MSNTDYPGAIGEMPREKFLPVIQQPIEVEQLLGKELTVCFYDLKGDHEFKTCIGDLCKSVNALMDYARMLEMVCVQWNLEGCHKAIYEYHAEKLREIAGRFGAAIGYDYAAAIEKCRKKRERASRENDVGEDALTQMYRRSLRQGKEKQKSPAEADFLEETDIPDSDASTEQPDAESSPWEDDD